MKHFLVLLFLAVVISATGCGTIRGIGQDIAAVGNGLSSASEKIQQDIQNGHNRSK